MGLSYNRVILMGNITRDVELKYTQGGTELVSFAIAVSGGYKDKNSGQWVEQTVFIDCTAWGKKATFISEYFSKGSPIHIEGRLKLDTWDDKQGQKRQKLTVTVDNCTFCGSRGTQHSNGAPQGAPPQEQPHQEQVGDATQVPF